jgi:ADP-heptose:LPS heptosyltransferase
VIAALNAAGRRVCLVAPGPGGRALLGPGGSEVASWLDASRADLAPLWARDAEPPAGLRHVLGPDAIAYAASADADLAHNLARLAGRVVVQPPAPPPGVHAADWLAQPLHSLGFPPPRELPSLAFTEDERDAASEWTSRLPERFVAVHPGSGSPRKNASPELYAKVADALSPDAPFLAIEGPADEAGVEALRRLPRAIVVRNAPVRVLGAVLASAGVFVGNDSGVTHLAAAAGAPTLALFGPTDPTQWAPIGARVGVHRRDPMDAMKAVDVADAASTLWERGPRSR